jgi:dihydroorotate dehydrogenase
VRLRCAPRLPDTPIIGTGGVTSGVDVVEMLMAGATAVGVGSAVYYRGPAAITAIRDELAPGAPRAALLDRAHWRAGAGSALGISEGA